MSLIQLLRNQEITTATGTEINVANVIVIKSIQFNAAGVSGRRKSAGVVNGGEIVYFCCWKNSIFFLSFSREKNTARNFFNSFSAIYTCTIVNSAYHKFLSDPALKAIER